MRLVPTKRSCLYLLIFLAGSFLVYLPSLQQLSLQFHIHDIQVIEGDKLWFISNAEIRANVPSLGSNGRTKVRLWPQEHPGHDRIIDQLMFVPRYKPTRSKIVVTNHFARTTNVSKVFEHCPVNTCSLQFPSDRVEKSADAIIFREESMPTRRSNNSKQIWILYELESPLHSSLIRHPSVINWTATYRTDSDIVTPYGKWIYYHHSIKQLDTPLKNFAANKTKQVAWFVSNCRAKNNRFAYAKELRKYINVDIFGKCGSKKCPRRLQSKCFDMLGKDYKFYLAFENSNCREYITEKFFVNGLGNDVLPIVMGARPEDYELVAPMKSYIHVDEFESPKQLAEYLHKLDADDNLYNEYFRWKGTGEFINTHFFCRVCALLHDQYPIKSYRDINEWWRSVGTCTSGSWRRPKENHQPAWGNQFG